MNSLVRSQQAGMPAVGTRNGMWVWDGSQWICSPCDSGDAPPFPCPPPGWPPAGCPPWFSGMNSPPWYPGANAGVSFGTVAPSNPVRGHFWWNGVTLWLFDGAEWVAVGGSGAGGSGTGGAYIGTTPPSNPFPGQQWWNGSIMQVWDGSTWHAVGPGASAGPVPTTTIMFTMTATVNRTIPSTAGTWGIVPFNDIPGTDPQDGWDSATHQYRPIKAGMYEVNVRMPGFGGACGVAVLKNDPGTFANALASDIIVAIASLSGGGWAAASGIVLMNGATDYLRCWAWSTDGIFHAAGSNQVLGAVMLP